MTVSFFPVTNIIDPLANIKDEGQTDQIFNKERIIHNEFDYAGHTVNSAFYVEVFKNQLQRIYRDRSLIFHTEHFMLLHAMHHRYEYSCTPIFDGFFTVLYHSPYFLDVAPAHLFLF